MSDFFSTIIKTKARVINFVLTTSSALTAVIARFCVGFGQINVLRIPYYILYPKGIIFSFL